MRGVGVGREGMREEGCAKRGGREEAVREQCASAAPGQRPVSRAWIGKPELGSGRAVHILGLTEGCPDLRGPSSRGRFGVLS